MKNVSIIFMVIMAVAFESHAFEIKTVSVINGGTITSTGSYYSFAPGEKPAFENEANYKLYAKGNVGFADEGIYSGNIGSQQQIEVKSGFGKLETKVGNGTLSINEENGVLIENAAGFSTDLKNGMVTVGFNTAGTNGFTAMAEAQGTGMFKAGAVGKTTAGGLSNPTITERSAFHVTIGPNATFQTQIQFNFHKVGE